MGLFREKININIQTCERMKQLPSFSGKELNNGDTGSPERSLLGDLKPMLTRSLSWGFSANISVSLSCIASIE